MMSLSNAEPDRLNSSPDNVQTVDTLVQKAEKLPCTRHVRMCFISSLRLSAQVPFLSDVLAGGKLFDHGHPSNTV